MISFKPGRKTDPIVDFSTFSSVDSLFQPGPIDPWVKETASNLADFFIYSDKARFILPYGSKKLDRDDLPEVPTLLSELARRDSDVFGYEAYSTIERRHLSNDYLLPSFQSFYSWALNNPVKFRQRCELYRQKWIQNGHLSRVATNYVFNIERLKDFEEFCYMKKRLNLEDDDIFFAFDVVLRYSLYGQLAGENVHYLSHPIRERINLPTMEFSHSLPPKVPIRFGPYIYDATKKLGRDEYTAVLHQLRGIVRDRKIISVQPGEVEPDILREIAASVGLQARLRRGSKVAAIIVGILGAAGAAPVIGPAATIAGGAISIGAVIWGRRVPQKVTRWKWLRWALEWDLEQESKYSDSLHNR